MDSVTDTHDDWPDAGWGHWPSMKAGQLTVDGMKAALLEDGWSPEIVESRVIRYVDDPEYPSWTGSDDEFHVILHSGQRGPGFERLPGWEEAVTRAYYLREP